jgi:DNA-binding protein Fis
VDPLTLPLEELLYLRLGKFFDQLHGRKVPGLYRVLLDQVDRAVLRQALERADGQLATAAEFLDIDRNTLARKVKRFKGGRSGGKR